MKYRKRALVIEAEQFQTYPLPTVLPFLGTGDDSGAEYRRPDPPPTLRWEIKTLEGWLTISDGDWIIKGIAGEFYPCKPEIFAASYEEVAE